MPSERSMIGGLNVNTTDDNIMQRSEHMWSVPHLVTRSLAWSCCYRFHICFPRYNKRTSALRKQQTKHILIFPFYKEFARKTGNKSHALLLDSNLRRNMKHITSSGLAVCFARVWYLHAFKCSVIVNTLEF